jgi:hypothetical protein
VVQFLDVIEIHGHNFAFSYLSMYEFLNVECCYFFKVVGTIYCDIDTENHIPDNE